MKPHANSTRGVQLALAIYEIYCSAYFLPPHHVYFIPFVYCVAASSLWQPRCSSFPALGSLLVLERADEVEHGDNKPKQQIWNAEVAAARHS